METGKISQIVGMKINSGLWNMSEMGNGRGKPLFDPEQGHDL